MSPTPMTPMALSPCHAVRPAVRPGLATGGAVRWHLAGAEQQRFAAVVAACALVETRRTRTKETKESKEARGGAEAMVGCGGLMLVTMGFQWFS